MSDDQPAPPLPDRLSVDPASPHHAAAVFEHETGLRFNARERHDVEEYRTSEGWIKVPTGRTLDRKGRPLLIKLKGRVAACYRRGARVLGTVERPLHRLRATDS